MSNVLYRNQFDKSCDDDKVFDLMLLLGSEATKVLPFDQVEYRVVHENGAQDVEEHEDVRAVFAKEPQLFIETAIENSNGNRVCCLCEKPMGSDRGNNPDPLASNEKQCCNDCNETKVLPARESEA